MEKSMPFFGFFDDVVISVKFFLLVVKLSIHGKAV